MCFDLRVVGGGCCAAVVPLLFYDFLVLAVVMLLRCFVSCVCLNVLLMAVAC